MTEYITLLHEALQRARKAAADTTPTRHETQQAYLDGLAGGLATAYSMLGAQIAKDLTKIREGGAP